MKNSVKITIVLGIVASFFPVHPMMPGMYCLEERTLKTGNPLLNMNDLKISHSVDPNGPRISDDDPFFADTGLALSLAAIKILEESDKAKNKKTLETIRNSISQGTPVSSNMFIIKSSSTNYEVILFSTSTEFYSVFDPIEYWIKAPVSMSLKNWLTRKGFMGKDKKNAIFRAIFQGERERKERLTYIRDELPTDIYDKFAIEVPTDLLFIILSCLPGFNVDEERTRLIEQAEKKFHEEQQLRQQSRFTLFTNKYLS